MTWWGSMGKLRPWENEWVQEGFIIHQKVLGVASGTSLSVATPQVCVKTPEKDKTLQAKVHCPAGRSPTEQFELPTLTNMAFGSCLQDLITPRTSPPSFDRVSSPWPEPSDRSMEKEWVHVTSEVTDPARHGLAMFLWEKSSVPLDAQKPHLGFLGTDGLAEWESAGARQLSTSSDPRWRPDSAPWGLPGGSLCAGPLDRPTIPSPPSLHLLQIADSASMGLGEGGCFMAVKNNVNRSPALKRKHSWHGREQLCPPRRNKLKIKGTKVLPASLQIQEAKTIPQPGTG